MRNPHLPSRFEVVLTGRWLYDGTVERSIEIYSCPVQFASSRYNEYLELDESTPIPESPNGLLYFVGPTAGVDFPTLEEAKIWADKQPWGPVKWDKD